MDTKGQVLNLIISQNSPDNNVRRAGELNFQEAVNTNVSQVMYLVMELSRDENLGIDLRQLCLLHLKRLVPKYWSMAFQSFVGPPVSQELKQYLRGNLLGLVTSTKERKIRDATSYVIVQIAATDYPDEWPDLMSQLYELTTYVNNESCMVGGLTVINELFDDLITEEQFWEDNIGMTLTNHIIGLLEKDFLSSEIKNACVRLYQSIVKVFQSPEAFSSSERKAAILKHFEMVSILFTNILSVPLPSDMSSISVNDVKYRASIYNILNGIYKKLSEELILRLQGYLLRDFSFVSKIVGRMRIENLPSVSSRDPEDPGEAVSSLVIELLQLSAILQHKLPLSSDSNVFAQFVNDLVQCAALPGDIIKNYEADFNEYVTDLTGLSGRVSIRDSVYDLLSELNDQDLSEMFRRIASELVSSNEIYWEWKECYLFLLEGLVLNESEQLKADTISVESLLAVIPNSITYEVSEKNHPILTARCFLVLPKLLEKFEGKIPVEEIGKKLFMQMISFLKGCPSGEIYTLVKAGILVACTLFRNSIDLNKVLSLAERLEAQVTIFSLCDSSVEEGEEDTLAAALETIYITINIDNNLARECEVSGKYGIAELILKLALKDPANVQCAIDACESLKTLLDTTEIEQYSRCCEKCLPITIEVIRENDNATSTYSPALSLGLDFLSSIIDSAQRDAAEINVFGDENFSMMFSILNGLISRSEDDQILQSAGLCLGKLLEKTSERMCLRYQDPVTNKSGLDLLLADVSKFLSPNLSDSAAANCGSIVLSLIEKFQPYLGPYFPQILLASVKRLVLAKEVVIMENLIMVFCELALLSPFEMINFLANDIELPDPSTQTVKSGLSLVLPIWFQSYEITRGYEKIKKSTIALAKLFSLNDARLHSLIVDGDLIPYEGNIIITRSKKKFMPDRYTQIPASLKIIKLLLSELSFQCQQVGSNDVPVDAQEVEQGDDNEGDWEDLSDIGVPSIDKLKSYVDSDEEDDLYQDQNNDDALKNILVLFFKECVGKNLGNFQMLYNQLNEDEKKILAEYVVF